ncbi:F0F1 ATP synthase subunit delta [Cohnella thailandensis]|jgi:ATP synthase, F1 delta subunit|uniref:ATP synthase subunit delta n=1 Tax=Cohnella thailandensis TaxID=557557 RepID=A0A841T7Q0_9BACL|nr:F0F1 ATP synthase subunit delta [Cohnella thailandensis]MBB6638090.1 F0F1 ATP synthase subunit delta [Cohnella thailandensis]MBP1971984.1 F-type H+-transporting ATPase subunit delta [Cohnella thailandensis]
MSRSNVVAKRYAKAIFDVARGQNQIAEAETQLMLLVKELQNNAPFSAVLAAPNIPAEAKIGVVSNAFAGTLLPSVLNLVSLLIERGRQSELPAVYQAYLEVASAALGRADAYVTSAQPLSLNEKDQIAKKFGALLGKTIRVHDAVDASLLGGMTVRIGDTLYDGSLSGKLNRLDKALQSSAK